MNADADKGERWWSGITRYQWMVLALASLGWIFDVFEGQIYVSTATEALPDLLPGAGKEVVAYYDKVILAAFLLGGAVGGVLFGVVSDRVGRKKALTLTILTYSVFTCLSAFARTWWQLAAFRFLVALGVGGEWAVASTLVAEVFPSRARAHGQSIFHASSVLGTYLAVAAGVFVVAHHRLGFTIALLGQTWDVRGWRLGFMLGAVPALLIVWVRAGLREPESWLQARKAAERGDEKAGQVRSLFAPALRRRTLVGVGLAAVGLATFWGAHIYGKDTLRNAYAAADPAADLKRGEMLGMFLVTTGGGLGLLAFGPISERLGRRGAFLLFQLGGLVAALVLFHVLSGVVALCVFLPVFGFLTLGMHAGFAVYFPELFPTRLRGTGAGFCFNMGRILAAPVLFGSGWLQQATGGTSANTASLLSLLFIPGALLLFAPETRGRELPP